MNKKLKSIIDYVIANNKFIRLRVFHYKNKNHTCYFGGECLYHNYIVVREQATELVDSHLHMTPACHLLCQDCGHVTGAENLIEDYESGL